MSKIPKRITTALLNALGAGVVPRIGLDYIAVGRDTEVKALSQDLENIAEGGASFRFIVGRYGSGKSFLIQFIRNLAMEQGFVVADADISPERRLAGSKNQALATYRELMKNLATRTNPNGGAITLILEKWISSILTQVAQKTGKRPGDEGFDQEVETKILEVVNDLEGLVHGFDFANVIITYWQGYREDNSQKKDAALRWLRGEFTSKTEAKNTPLQVKVIIDDDSWYDYLKLFAKFTSEIGYKGLIIFLDEAIHLYKIDHSRSRQSNYDKLLAMFNDAMQGKAEYLGIIIGGTPQLIEDQRRGLYQDDAWRSRLVKSRLIQTEFQDLAAPVISLEPLTTEELSLLLQRLVEIQALHYRDKQQLKASEIEDFKQIIANRLGAEKLLTPREIIRDFLTVLNILQQNHQLSFSGLMQNFTFQTDLDSDRAKVSEEFAEFIL
jgi:hypothetical protein